MTNTATNIHNYECADMEGATQSYSACNKQDCNDHNGRVYEHNGRESYDP